MKWSHERKVRSFAKETFGSTFTGRAIRFAAVLWRRGCVDMVVGRKKQGDQGWSEGRRESGIANRESGIGNSKCTTRSLPLAVSQIRKVTTNVRCITGQTLDSPSN